MQLHHFRDLQHMQADHTFRTPPWGMLLLPVILTGICIALGWALVSGYLPCFFWASVAILAPLVPLVVAVNFLPALRPTNWVLKVRGDQLYVMLRNYRNRHFPDDDPVVASFDIGEIASVGKQEQRLSAPGSSAGREVHWTERRLEIRLESPVPDEFRQALEAERRRKPPAEGFIRARSYYPSPVSIDERTIRILWNGRHDVVKPSIERALDMLGRLVDVHGTAVLDRREVEDLSNSEFDDLILELCQSGNRMAAAKLLRRHRGYSTTEAKQLVDELLS